MDGVTEMKIFGESTPKPAFKNIPVFKNIPRHSELVSGSALRKHRFLVKPE
jgi:hypothetical protein